ncbi:UbiA prenyltransferase [Candidatus Vecturithrix granuli]|uniref:UbiA prenyltransferase n=1 Tax=Vecturithrix granuli TaxID=1499967 RepID=A0A081BW07_VECG1|nr:UbiA prenyltransferase [Candidatus Vecturithrix granuli]
MKRWLKASRLPSQAYIFFPLLLGQILAYAHAATWDWPIALLVHAFGLFIQLYIVYANDYADYQVDTLNDTYTIFSGGSRVLVDGDITPEALKKAAFLMVGGSLGTALLLMMLYRRPWALLLATIALLLLYAYSYPPFRLSYRGGGEFLQMIGVGGVLPLFGYYAQAGDFIHFPCSLFLILLPTNLACAIATSLPDEPSDRRGQKHTISVVFGNQRARQIILCLNFLTITQFLFLLVENIDGICLMGGIAVMTLTFCLSILFCRSAVPGTRSLMYFVFSNILITLLTTTGLALMFSA